MRLSAGGWRASAWALSHLAIRGGGETTHAYASSSASYACSSAAAGGQRDRVRPGYRYMSSSSGSPRVGDKRRLSISTPSSSLAMSSSSEQAHTPSCRPTSISRDVVVPATACVRCRGEGSVRARPSKKARAQRKRDMEAAKRRASEGVGNNGGGNGDDVMPLLPPPAPPRFVPCPKCNGSGIVPKDTRISSDASSSQQQPPKALPSIRSDVSVAIVGGGLGGLALALALQHRSIPCVVYERDANFDERSQGYGLTMQQAARAVKALGLTGLRPISEQNFGITSKRHVVHKTDGSVVGQWGLRVWGRPETKTKKEAGRQNAHIARQELRRMLLDRLEPGTVQWGYRLKDYKEIVTNDGEGEVDIFLRNESNEMVSSKASVLVGADGIRSTVCRLKVGDDVFPLRYLDCIVILGIAPTPTDSDLADGETVFQTADGQTRIYAMPFSGAGAETAGAASNEAERGRGEMMWQLSFPLHETDAKRLSSEGPAALKAEALARCGEWHAPIPELLRSTPDQLVSGYPVYDRDLLDAESLRYGQQNNERSKVTLIGDAAHPMSPFKGQGANQALLDAVLLARTLCKTLQAKGDGSEVKEIEDALAEFESEMLNRSAAKVKASADAAKFLHTEVAVAEGNHPRCTAAAKAAAEATTTS